MHLTKEVSIILIISVPNELKKLNEKLKKTIINMQELKQQ